MKSVGVDCEWECVTCLSEKREREIQSPMVDKRTFKVSHYLLL